MNVKLLDTLKKKKAVGKADDEYETPGLPAPPKVSKTTIPMAGFLVDVYGLDEAPKDTPLTCLWLLHARTRTRARMSDIACRTVHTWNQREHGKPSRALIALAFDMPNHGSRLVSDKANTSWKDGNTQHAIDMIGMIKNGSGEVSALMDVAGAYLGRPVDAHMCLGWSLGGHMAWETWMRDPRIQSAVIVVGCPDLMALMTRRAKNANLDCGGKLLGSKYFPDDLVELCKSHDPKGILFCTDALPSTPLSPEEQARVKPILDSHVRGKKLLLCSGGDDKLVPYAVSKPFLGILKSAVTGWYKDGGVSVDDRVYEGVGHKFDKDMVQDAVKFLIDAAAEGPKNKPKI